MKDTLRQRAEEQTLANDAQGECVSMSPEDGRKVLHELRVHQIELEMQNEELRRSQIALKTLQRNAILTSMT
ncbi:hypothetical protein [Solidesulfovibrio magneticus]|uniref:hypothetical protein n=1 Tax=Solidesulfovibrio magneticus TaxID=184917 RepID=UPI0018E0BAEF|nr:hypothetical protein [Solidesulfovibrio magneticus]